MINFYPYPIRIKVSLWTLLNQHLWFKGVLWGLEALVIGCIIAGIILWVR